MAWVAGVLWAGVASAVPYEVAHQTRVFDAGGVALAGQHAVEVRLYDVASGGAPLQVEAFTAVPFDDGTFSVRLGGDAANPLVDAELSGGARWIGVSVDGGPELSPRTEVGSLPYAARAGFAERGAHVDPSGLSCTSATRGALRILSSPSELSVCDGTAWRTVGPATAPQGPPTWLDVGVGQKTTCGLGQDGKITCWGQDTDATVRNAPTGTFAQLSASFSNAMCALDAAGLATCWGESTSNQLTEPTVPFSAIGGGDRNWCGIAIADGALYCWGNTSATPGVGPTAGPWVQVSGGQNHTCARKATGEVTCWGDNTNGQLTVPSGVLFSDIEAGHRRTCGIRQDTGAVQCWGDVSTANSWLPLPTGSFIDVEMDTNFGCLRRTDRTIQCWKSPVARTPPAGVQIRMVRSGNYMQCGLDDAGVLYCWGNDDKMMSTRPHERVGPWSRWASNSSNHCGVKADGTVACFGNSTQYRTAAPTGTFVAIDVGDDGACARAASGALTCWAGAVNPAPAGSYTLHSLGATFGCALDAAGAVMCWGTNTDSVVSARPTSGVYSHLDAGEGHACAVAAGTGAVTCWGRNDVGQSTPPSTTGFTKVAAGRQVSCALNAAGNPVCWGSPTNQVITTLPSTTTFTDLVVGWTHACGRRPDQSVLCWGDTSMGRATVPSNPGFVDLHTNHGGAHHICGVTTAGQATCWGWTRF
jgi:alpha-tubulin suppressor-like RCC1 family protein